MSTEQIRATKKVDQKLRMEKSVNVLLEIAERTTLTEAVVRCLLEAAYAAGVFEGIDRAYDSVNKRYK